jgi:hypothetical protein
MCAKYSAEWWQRVAQASSEQASSEQATSGLGEKKQAAPDPGGSFDNRKTEIRQDRSAQPNELLATPAGR